MATTIDREIHFYRIDAGLESSGKFIIFDPIPALEHIDKLKWDIYDSKERYWKDDNKLYGCWIDSKQIPCKLQFGIIRRMDLPQVEQLGEVTALEIAEDAGLVERTHIVFLGDNIVGCDFNFYGPRISRLSYYLGIKAFGIVPPMLEFNPILRTDVYSQLLAFKYLKSFNLTVLAPYSEKIKDIDKNLWRALTACQKVSDGDIVELILTASKRSTHKGWLGENALRVSKELAKQKDRQYDMTKFIVRGWDEKKQDNIELNLLSDKLLIKKSIMRVERRSRALNPDSAYRAIISAYVDLKEEIAHLDSIGLN
jgi:hypothetical protein